MRMDMAVERLIAQAAQSARSMGHSCVGSAHLLLSLCSSGTEAGYLLRGAGVDAALIRSAIGALWGTGNREMPLPQGFTEQARRILRGAGAEAGYLKSPRVRPVHLLLAILRNRHSQAWQLIRLTGVNGNALFTQAVLWCRREPQISETIKRENGAMKLLEQFSEDMILKAASMEPVIGREAEIDTVIGILCRKNKNNPALIGEPGVGKTAVAEGLAQRMAAGNVPPQLKGKRLISLHMSNLVAGTKYRGEFEERLRDLLGEIRRSGNLILFVDEMHTMVGAGAAEGAIDAANIFKPALGRGELQMLGATTLTEYRKYIEKDPALERRFRPVTVYEPDDNAAMAILEGLRPGLEQHHGLRITREAMEEAIRMSRRYLPEQFLPDKAIDLLDEGAAHAGMLRMQQGSAQRKELEQALNQAVRDSRYEQAAQLRDKMQQLLGRPVERRSVEAVTASHVAWAVSCRTGIPVGKLTADERSRLLSLEETLQTQILGQHQAVQEVAETVCRGLSGLRDGDRPVATMLFTGPTGVGKTETCRVLAKELYGSKEALLRLDMTEYMEKHSVARLIGAPPGYVGYEEGGKLTEAVRRRPYCLVLLDELEKAHPDICGILLQIMEEGELTDSAGHRVSFRNAMVVMTSNVGAGQQEGLGFQPAGTQQRAKDALRSAFTPEFLGRLDKTVAFQPLTEDALEGILEKYLKQLAGRAESAGLQLKLPPDLAVKLKTDKLCRSGARHLRRVVQEKVEGPLSEYLLKTGRQRGTVEGVWQEEILCFRGN